MQKTLPVKKVVENILVVPRSALFSRSLLAPEPGVTVLWDGLAGELEDVVATAGLFLPRPEMEEDPTYKQIIPYIVFVHERRIFVMQRSSKAGEQRLAEKYTIGIGGHVRQTDMAAGGLAEWGRREFEEEVAYKGKACELKLFGLVNDDTNAVGRVHVGAIFVIQGDSDAIRVRSELKSGVLMDREECVALRPRMESWSQFVLDALIEAGVV